VPLPVPLGWSVASRSWDGHVLALARRRPVAEDGRGGRAGPQFRAQRVKGAADRPGRAIQPLDGRERLTAVTVAPTKTTPISTGPRTTTRNAAVSRARSVTVPPRPIMLSYWGLLLVWAKDEGVRFFASVQNRPPSWLLAGRRSRPDLTEADTGVRTTLATLATGLGTVAAYAPLPREPGGAALPAALAAVCARLLLPVVRPDLDLDWAEYTGSLAPAAFGLTEPPGVPSDRPPSRPPTWSSCPLSPSTGAVSGSAAAAARTTAR